MIGDFPLFVFVDLFEFIALQFRYLFCRFGCDWFKTCCCLVDCAFGFLLICVCVLWGFRLFVLWVVRRVAGCLDLVGCWFVLTLVCFIRVQGLIVFILRVIWFGTGSLGLV